MWFIKFTIIDYKNHEDRVLDQNGDYQESETLPLILALKHVQHFAGFMLGVV